MPDKSDAFFVISNFNSDPMVIADYAKNYVILDQSNNQEIREYLLGLQNSRIQFSKHVGHNLLDYLDWIISNWDSMPNVVAFLKGNVIGRHIDPQHWETIYRNTHYTFVFSNKSTQGQKNRYFSAHQSDFNEINNSWFAWSSNHRYFTSTNQLIHFLYKSPRYPQYLTFSPGACYIVESSRIKNKPLSLYIGLRQILSYTFFPSEAWMVERILHTIFFSQEEFKPYVYSEEEFLLEISKLPDRSSETAPAKSKSQIITSKIYWKVKSLIRLQRSVDPL